jgi:hypothetical protein
VEIIKRKLEGLPKHFADHGLVISVQLFKVDNDCRTAVINGISHRSCYMPIYKVSHRTNVVSRSRNASRSVWTNCFT